MHALAPWRRGKGIVMPHHRLLALSVLVLFTVAVPSWVRADPNVERLPPKNGYSYVFTDDPLAAGAFGANEARIPVLRHVLGGTLIRPRTDFVPELLKTVESL
jgi:hypothetical protein